MPKRPSPLEEPPSASSSSEESEDMEVEEGEEEEEEVEESEEEQEERITNVKSSGKKSSSSTKSNPTAISTPQPRSHSEEVSDSDEASDSDSDSDSQPSAEKPKPSVPNVKPISSKPMANNAKSKKPLSATTSATAATATPTKGSKRSLEMDKSENDSKQKTKKKKETEDADEENGRAEETEKKQGGEDSKKLFQRIWSDEDEIVILKGLLSYKKKGLNPSTNVNAFLDSIKSSLQIDVNRSQLSSKLHRLKHRYFSQASRAKDGEDPRFTKPHEAKAYQLSKKIWGDKEGKEDEPEVNNAGSDSVKADAKKTKGGKFGNGVAPISQPKVPVALESHLEVSENKEEEQMLSLGQFGKSLTMPPSVLADYIAKEGSATLGSEETKKFEQKWRKLLLAETKIYIQRLELAREYSLAIANKLEAADS